MKCFYHADLDGQCSAFWVKRYCDNNGIEYTEDDFIQMDYAKPFPFIRNDEEIWIVDYSIEPEEMAELLDAGCDITWIDHHKTAIDKYKDFGEKIYDELGVLDGVKPVNIKGIRVDGVAACELTWYYTHFKDAVDSIPRFMDVNAKIIPYFTRLIGDWDVWKFEYGDETRQFQAGMLMEDCSPLAEVWSDLTDENAQWVGNNIIDAGKGAIKYRDQWAKDYVRHLGFETEFEGHRCFAVNLGHCNSEYFKSVEDKNFDIFIPFSYNGENWTVSLYSKNVDVSEIAKKFKGGGHKGASGFQCKELPFQKES